MNLIFDLVWSEPAESGEWDPPVHDVQPDRVNGLLRGRPRPEPDGLVELHPYGRSRKVTAGESNLKVFRFLLGIVRITVGACAVGVEFLESAAHVGKKKREKRANWQTEMTTSPPPSSRQIWADPADINVLSEYTKDPRVATNLIDGVYRTHDDMHLWLAPFTPGGHHFIHLVFKQPASIALIRVWVGPPFTMSNYLIKRKILDFQINFSF